MTAPFFASTNRTPSLFPTALPELPSRVFIALDHSLPAPAAKTGEGRFSVGPASVSLIPGAQGMDVRVGCPSGPISRVVLRWNLTLPADALYLADHWERSYGDLQWRALQPERVMPWYFAAHRRADGASFFAGVKVQPAAFCFWTADPTGLSLWLDLRNGGGACFPGAREIEAATVLSGAAVAPESPFDGLARFCRQMSPRPRLAAAPICGNNNWYYAYGKDFTADTMRGDAAFLAELAGGHRNRPFCVIDAGWNPGGVCPGGPWTAGDAATFPDLPGLAADMAKLGVRPGIWIRPTALSTVDDPGRLRPGPCTVPEKPLDLTLPENLTVIRQDIERVRSWGYELIKHDFSTYDAFGRWGFQMGAEITTSDWNFHNRTLTNAEVILRLYRTLREGAGDALLLGCNTVGHLGAGLFEIQRTGDDTSGLDWERTRRMGVNTLAFRLPQHNAFFACDPDCAPHTAQTPWELDRQYLDLVARSGTALFVSVNPRTVTAEQKSTFAAAMRLALSGGAAGGCRPLDWLDNSTPNHWQFGPATAAYDWDQPFGTSPFHV